MIATDIKYCNRCDTELTESGECKPCHKKSNAITNPIFGPKSNPLRMWVNGKYISSKHPLYKAGRYKSFGDLAFGSLNNYNLIKEGYVYAIRNAAWPEWIKIGKAIDADDRLSSYQTSSPMRDYKLVHSVYFDDRNAAEKKAHILAAFKTAHPWNKHDNGEWFKLTDEQAVEILKEITID